MCMYRSIQKQKMAFTGHVLKRSSGDDALQMLEGKLEVATAQGIPLWWDDIKQWTHLNTYEDIERLAQDRCQWTACTAACQSF